MCLSRSTKHAWWHLAMYGQVPGVDVFNIFAPVVKSITARLLLALAFIFICMICGAHT